MGSTILLGIVLIGKFALTSLTEIVICGSCPSCRNSWSPLDVSCPTSSTINSVSVYSSATSTVHLVHCFWCFKLGCPCLPSFLVVSCHPLATGVVVMLVATHWSWSHFSGSGRPLFCHRSGCVIVWNTTYAASCNVSVVSLRHFQLSVYNCCSLGLRLGYSVRNAGQGALLALYLFPLSPEFLALLIGLVLHRFGV